MLEMWKWRVQMLSKNTQNPSPRSIDARTVQTCVSDIWEPVRMYGSGRKQGDRTVMVAALGKETESGRALAQWTCVEKSETGNLAN